MVYELVHYGASLEEMSYDERRSEVVVHGVIALLAQLAHNLLCLGVALCRSSDAVEVGDAVHEFLKTLLRSLQRLVREVDCAAVVSREDEEAYGHRRVGLLKILVVAREELLESDEVAE